MGNCACTDSSYAKFNPLQLERKKQEKKMRKQLRSDTQNKPHKDKRYKIVIDSIDTEQDKGEIASGSDFEKDDEII